MYFRLEKNGIRFLERFWERKNPIDFDCTLNKILFNFLHYARYPFNILIIVSYARIRNHGVVENAKDNTIQSYVTLSTCKLVHLIFPRSISVNLAHIHTHTHTLLSEAKKKLASRVTRRLLLLTNCDWKRNIYIVRAQFYEFALKNIPFDAQTRRYIQLQILSTCAHLKIFV